MLCSGHRTYAAHIENERVGLAWTEILRSLTVQLDAAVERRLSNVLERLVLRMRVADLKPTPASEPVWLEFNPQGSGFLEGLTGTFRDFLLNEARTGRRRTVAPLDPLIALASTERTCPA